LAPEIKAASLFEKLPGASLTSKASSLLFGASIFAFLISKEIYILDHEVFETVAIFAAFYAYYTAGKGPVNAYCDEKRNVNLL
jgi:hypothetical protein